MTNKKNIIILINPNTEVSDVKKAITNPKTSYTLYIPTKYSKLQDAEKIEAIRGQLTIPQENHITIHISSIVQKTWRIIHHYSSSEPVPEKNTPDRKSDLIRIGKANQQRLDDIEKSIKEIVIKDQATKLGAEVIVIS